MASSYTSLLGLVLPVQGELQGTWGDTVNNQLTSLLDTAIAGTTTLSTDADVTLTDTDGASNQARQAILLCTGARTALRTLTAPAQSKAYIVINDTTGGYAVKLVGAGPTTGVTVLAGEKAVVAWNGSDFVKISTVGGSPSFTDVTVTGTTTLSGLTASTALALNASKEVVSVTNTGTGNNVLATSPTLVTPNLGTPSAATLTNATGLPVSTGISGLGSGVATFLATPSSANLAAAVTDETGTGALVFATSPSLTTPNLGTPSAVTLTNATDLPVSSGISGLGAGVATFLATPSSANLAAAVTDETGTGALVFATSPSLTTPTLGAASATSINKVTITAPATGSTLTVADGKTLTANSSLTLAGTDGTTMTFPSTNASIARTDAAQTFTGVNTFRAVDAVRSEAAATQDAVVLAGRAGGTSSYAVTLTPTTLSANRTITLPDAAGTAALLSGTQTFSGTTTFSSTFTLSGTTQNLSLGTSQTSGTWTAGGTAQTGKITLGRSTGNQTVAIADGAVASGNTSTVNIGANGLSGSTTQVNIGPSASGATGQVNTFGTVNIYTATSASVALTANITNGNGVVASIALNGASGNVAGFTSGLTAAASSSTSEYSEFLASGASLGSGASVGVRYGFSALDNSGPISSYSFFTDQTKGAGTSYAFIAIGDAPSYFGGDVGVAGTLGYTSGAGGAVTQTTSRTQTVSVAARCGAITLVSAAGTTTWQSFTVNCFVVKPTDTIIVNQKSGTDLYMIHVTNVASGSFRISFATTGGTTTEQPVFNFAVISAVTS